MAPVDQVKLQVHYPKTQFLRILFRERGRVILVAAPRDVQPVSGHPPIRPGFPIARQSSADAGHATDRVGEGRGKPVVQRATALCRVLPGPTVKSAPAAVLFLTPLRTEPAWDACYLAHSRSGNVMHLLNDAGTALWPGQSMAASGSVSNSQCSVAWSGTAVATAGNSLTLTLSITFTSSFIYMAARDVNEANNTGWDAMGTWTPQ